MDLISDVESSDDDGSISTHDQDSTATPAGTLLQGKVTLLPTTDPRARQYLVRSTPHVRGNWAGHVYIQLSHLTDVRDRLVHTLVQELEQAGYHGPLLLHGDDDPEDSSLHLSLHRNPFYLQVASIEPFVKALQQRFQHESSVTVVTGTRWVDSDRSQDTTSPPSPRPSQLLQLVNASQTRRFYALPVQASDALERFHGHVTDVLSLYDATAQPQDFLFHVSIASLPLGNNCSATSKDIVPRNVSVPVPLLGARVRSIHVRFGTTKHYEIPLRD